jgi:predicted AlkP superfamily phosphohydrolase/phosphomutase
VGLLNFLKPKVRRVFVVGLDCAAPELVFQQWRDDLPNLRSLAERGMWGEMQSCTPAITVPAWSSMLSSKDPGVLGIYGFRNRADHSYDKMSTAMSTAVREKRVWDILGDAGKRSVVLGVPQTYPVQPLNGWLVSDFLTPGRHNAFAYPPELRDEVLRVAPAYDFDVPDFRSEDKGWLLKQVYAMTDTHFAVIDRLMAEKPWDFFMSVEIGVDRMHHGFWSHHDPRHFRYQAGNPFERAIHDYYVYIDRKLGEWLGKLPADTAVLVVSDHGAKRMDGGICLNEWLWRNGYLAFKQDPVRGQVTPLEKLEIDWSRTTAWGSGGYYGRVFLNVQGREPQGIIPADQYETMRAELAHKLAAIPDTQGRDIGTRVFRPQDIYRQVNGIAPDLIVYFGDLLWRSVGTLGYDSVYTFDNDTGPDDCNHAQNGMFILADPRQRNARGREVEGVQLMDIAPTILRLFDVAVPGDMQGRALI